MGIKGHIKQITFDDNVSFKSSHIYHIGICCDMPRNRDFFHKSSEKSHRFFSREWHGPHLSFQRMITEVKLTSRELGRKLLW